MTERTQRCLGIALFVMALITYTATVLTIALERTPFYNLPPSPDAIEYFAGGLSIAEEGDYQIHVSGQSFPPRYPFGYSLLMVPFFWLGFESIEVPFRVNQVLGAALVACFFVYLWTCRLYLEAGLAALLLTTFPAFIIQARSPMSEMPATIFLAVGIFSIHRFWSIDRLLWGLIGACAFALAVWCRIALLPMLLVSFLGLILKRSGSFRRQVTDAAAFTFTVLGSLVPLLAYNHLSFGSPFLSGYHLWLGEGANVTSSFGFQYLSRNLLHLGREVIQHENLATTASHYGEGSFFGPAFVVLLLLTGLTYRRSRTFLVFAIPAVLYFLMMMVYFYPSARMLSPLLVVSIPSVSLAWCMRLRKSKNWLTMGLLLFLMFCQLSMFPGTRFDPDFDRYVRTSRLNGSAEDYLAVSRFNRLRSQGPSLILTDLSPPYVYALTEGDRTVFPLTGKHDYRWGPVTLGSPEYILPRQVGRAVVEDERIYALVSHNPVYDIDQYCPSPPGFSWKVIYANASGQWIAELASNSSK